MHRRRAILCTASSKRIMKRAHKTLVATVRKIIKPFHPTQPEKAETSIDEADDLYREIRIENTSTDENGKATPQRGDRHRSSDRSRERSHKKQDMRTPDSHSCK